MNRRAIAICTLILPFALPAFSQKSDPPPYDRASGTFAAADRNRDGLLDARELSRASIPASAVKSWDHDRDGGLSKDEFLLYYRQLMVNAGQEPGSKLQEEVRRIEARRRSEETMKAERLAREKELDELRLNQGTKKTTKETTEERFKKAQAALKGRVNQAGKSSEAAAGSKQPLSERARQALGAGAGAADADASAWTAKRLARAGTALDGAAGEESSAAGRADLDRALAALDERAKKGGWTRERHEAARKDLIKRANVERAGRKGTSGDAGDPGTGTGLGNRAGTNRADLARALLALEQRAKDGGWTRERYEEERRQLIERANKERAGTAGQKGGGNGAGAVPVSGERTTGQDGTAEARQRNAVLEEGANRKVRQVDGRSQQAKKHPAGLKAAGEERKAPPQEEAGARKAGKQGARQREARKQGAGKIRNQVHFHAPTAPAGQSPAGAVGA